MGMTTVHTLPGTLDDPTVPILKSLLKLCGSFQLGQLSLAPTSDHVWTAAAEVREGVSTVLDWKRAEGRKYGGIPRGTDMHPAA